MNQKDKEKSMKNTIMTLTQLIQHATAPASPINKATEQIAQIVEKEIDREAAVKAIAELALDIRDLDKGNKERTPESDERAYAFHLCHAFIGLCQYNNGEKTAFIPQWAIDEIEEILSTKVQWVATNQGSSDHKRFYTEDLSEQNWSNLHHLIDLDHQRGKDYSTLTIHQFKEGSEGKAVSVQLSHNEVEELLSVILQQRLEEAEQWHNERKNAPSGDDFDPFLDSDELP